MNPSTRQMDRVTILLCSIVISICLILSGGMYEIHQVSYQGKNKYGFNYLKLNKLTGSIQQCVIYDFTKTSSEHCKTLDSNPAFLE